MADPEAVAMGMTDEQYGRWQVQRQLMHDRMARELNQVRELSTDPTDPAADAVADETQIAATLDRLPREQGGRT